MYLLNSQGQHTQHPMFDASGTITTGSVPQLVLPRAQSRTMLIFVNNSTDNMYIEVGSARASATLTSGVISSIAVTNAGFGYSIAPTVEFLGGNFGNALQTTPTYSLVGTPDMYSPPTKASAHCVMTGAAPNMSVSSIVIDNGGKNYLYPPYVYLRNNDNDPFGCALPALGTGFELISGGGNWTPNGTVMTTDPIAVFCATTSAPFTCKWM